ncbi:c-type cytochrome biogenesis protein CcmI/CycH [Luteimonas deserti]|uniref:Cytochrome C biogenesis protein n=1 Tax=Luteimonas deserti TaxID=2752306 RepID=A0A7Z0QPB4_9GAMM|nr:cytochrome C biogenesis protein [Luteimonas deserti]NYZ61260.1 cytochrome C biogenesis protein [Luteimonas deserti]
MALFLLIALLMSLATTALLVRGLRRGAPRVALGVGILVPLLVASMYLLVGTPAALDPDAVRAPESLEDAVARLEADLQRDPRQPEGWLLLGRAYAGMERPEDARDAIGRAAALLPDEDGVQVEYAQARANAAPGRRFDAEAVTILRDVLARTPDHQHARWFLGIAQRQDGDDAAAVATWTPLLDQLDAATAATLRAQIEVARAAAGTPPAGDAAVADPASSGLRVRVELDPTARSRLLHLPAGAQVFVIAREPGNPMPVAVQRHPAASLPLEIALGDGDGPMPTQRLSALARVEVLARVSASGRAEQGPDDLQAPAVVVDLPSAAPVVLQIRAER